MAEKKKGEMLGEMAFFDNKPRSAGAKAVTECEVISLPFTSLYAQFKTFPEWLKAVVRTVNGHLRDANARIKNLEQAQGADEEVFPPHLITRLTAVISLVGFKSGEETEGGLVVPFSILRNYCIQIFQQPTNKLEKMMEVLQEKGLLENKLREEADELCEAKDRSDVVHEWADVVYFATVLAIREGLSIEDLYGELERRSWKVSRRPGNAKPQSKSEESSDA